MSVIRTKNLGRNIAGRSFDDEAMGKKAPGTRSSHSCLPRMLAFPSSLDTARWSGRRPCATLCDFFFYVIFAPLAFLWKTASQQSLRLWSECQLFLLQAFLPEGLDLGGGPLYL